MTWRTCNGCFENFDGEDECVIRTRHEKWPAYLCERCREERSRAQAVMDTASFQVGATVHYLLGTITELESLARQENGLALLLNDYANLQEARSRLDSMLAQFSSVQQAAE